MAHDNTSQTDPPDDHRDWLTRALLPDGGEPDPRFTLANERTFLAWIRTSLALSAGGLGIEAFGADVFDERTRKGLGILLLCLAVVMALGAVRRWVRVERAMRSGQPLPVAGMAPVIAAAVALGALLMVFVIATR